MNKKGAVLLHWILFGIIAAIGMFLYYAGTFAQTSAGRGPWQLDMINSFLYQSELDLIELDLQARNTGQKVAMELAEKGGFIDTSPCGVVDGANQWNSLEKSCFPPIKENAEKLFFQQFVNPEKNPPSPPRTFTKFTIAGKRIAADGGIKKNERTQPYLRSYTYSYSFNANLLYDFAEYDNLFAEARFLVDSCRNQKDLTACLQSKKPVHWQYQSCDNPQAPSTGRIWKFCAESPSQSKIQNKPVRYSLALDFTPTIPFSVVGITVSPSAGKYKITFPRDANTDGYRVYYTDARLLDYRGKADQIIIGSGYFKDETEILQSAVVDDPLRCGSGAVDQEAHKAYWCGGGLITYVLEDSRLSTGKDYYFTVTAFIGKDESEIAEFVKG